MIFIYLFLIIFIGLKTNSKGLKDFALFLLFLTSFIWTIHPIFSENIKDYTMSWYIFLLLVNFASIKFISTLESMNGRILIMIIVFIQCLIYGGAVLEWTLLKKLSLYEIIEEKTVLYILNIIEVLIAGVANGQYKLARYINNIDQDLRSLGITFFSWKYYKEKFSWKE